MRALCGLLAMALASCAADAVPSDSPSAFDNVRVEDARELPPSAPFVEGRPGAAGGTVFDPLSAELEPAVPYRFSLGHCGLHSPVDLDGSFWDPIDGVTADGQRLDLESDGEMINATAGVVVVIGDEARFRTESGSVVRFARHEGEKEFPGCA
jgi:hypothetical protein